MSDKFILSSEELGDALATATQGQASFDAAAWEAAESNTKAAIKKAYDPSEPRDDQGQWTSGGAQGGMAQSIDDDETMSFQGGPSFGRSTPEKFVAARATSRRSAYMANNGADDLKGHQLFLNETGKVGYALDKEGDLQNVFNNSGVKGEGAWAVKSAVVRGANTLDAFDGYLPQFYEKYGFVETGRMKFDKQYAPPDWNYARDGTPDVVFMAYQGGNRASIGITENSFPHGGKSTRYFADYDQAKADSRTAVKDK